METSESYETEILDILKKMTAKQFYSYVANMLKVLGKFAIDFGELQESSPLFMVFQRMREPTIAVATVLGSKLIEEIEEEKIGPLLKTLAKLPLFPDLSKPLETTAEEKIKAGKAFIETGERIEALLK